MIKSDFEPGYKMTFFGHIHKKTKSKKEIAMHINYAIDHNLPFEISIIENAN